MLLILKYDYNSGRQNKRNGEKIKMEEEEERKENFLTANEGFCAKLHYVVVYVHVNAQ